MTYQTAYKLLVAAYKSAKGIMPEGLDLLKIKQKARQKVIDAKKVIEFPKERITNPFKPRPTETEIMMKKTGIPVTVKGKTTTMTPDGILKMLMGKGKGKDVKIGQAPKTTKRKPAVDPKLTQEENIKRIMAENKAAAKRLQEKMNKPKKSLGEKLRDYDGDPDGMAGGGKVKKPFTSKVVDFLGGPAAVGAELGFSGLIEIYNLLGMPLMKDGGKVKKKRKHNDNVDDEDIGEGKSKERFLRVMPQASDIPRSDGIMELATGGMTNISDTYDNNPTLQSQYPNKQDYLDLFAQQTTTTTPQTNTTTQATTSTIAPINPIKPIIPLPQDSGDGDGGILNNLGRTNMNQPNAMGGKEPGIVAALQRTLGDVKTAGKEIYSILSPMQMAKKTMDSINNMRAKKAAEIIEQIRREEEARLQAQLNRPRVPGGTIDSGNQGSGGYGGTGGEGPSAVGSSGMLGGGV